MKTQVYGDRLTLKYLKDRGMGGPITVPKDDGQMEQTIFKNNTDEMLTRAKGSDNLRWEVSRDAFAFLTNNNASSYFPPSSFYGHPLCIKEDGPDLGEVGDIVLHCDDGDVLLAKRE